MDLRYLKFTVTLFFVERIWSLPLGCSYNGTAFAEGQTVTTEEPCLFCVCQGGALECSLRVCADQPNVLPPGCFFLHKPNECCPQLFCEESFNPSGVELRTGTKLENKINGNDCTINGSRYAEGSAVASSQVCEYCYCVEGETKCIKPRCLQSFEGCKAVYEKSSCCPTHYDCREADINRLSIQIENFVLANPDSKHSNDSLRTLSSSYLENGNTNSSNSESAENLSEKEEQVGEEVGGTTTQEMNTEETTVQPEETTTPTEDNLTSGFQTLVTEYSNKEATVVDTTEGTPEPEATTNAFSSLEASNAQNGYDSTEATPAQNDSRNESSQEIDDYEAYDYGEPQLPPSLPNLVIFPFVAADAVVKDESDGILDKHDKIEIKRIDAHPVFYKDYFSPPVKTEGGFVPKEPFYEEAYFREDQMESPGADPPCRDVLCPLPVLDKQWAEITSATTMPGEAENVKSIVTPRADSPTDFSLKEESQKSQQTKKPVTVTYKNIVVDFYPNYLITTTRARPKIRPDGNSVAEVQLPPAGSLRNPTSNMQNVIPSETKLGFFEEPLSSTSPTTTAETLVAASTGGTTAESFFFDEFFKSFLSDEIISSTVVTTTTTGTKHKYSSKIKGHANAVRDDGSEKGKPEFPKTTNSVLNTLNVTEKSTVPVPATHKPIIERKKDGGTKNSTEVAANLRSTTSEPMKINRGTVEFLQDVGKDNQNGKQGSTDLGSREESNSLKPDAGALLKLAGCNIYGMMYRVGKLITELSGPCLECLCTDLGVQCRPLGC